MMDKINLKLLPQECNGNGEYLFSGPLYCTSAFQEKYGDKCYAIILEALALVHERTVKFGADYLQVFQDGNKEKFYLIDDISHVTILLSSDY